MEGENGIPAPPPSPASGSRWNPTKEQISLLEGLYKEGMRTPTAEQIQHITGRLKKYGRIEGKNVFYWFQNHKARQRQKQKQESFGYFARFLRNRAGPPVLYPAPPPPALLPATPACAAVNVVRAPFCMPQYAGAIGFYPTFQRVFLTGAAHLGPEGVLQMVETEAYGTPEGPNNPHRQLYDDDCTSAPTDERGACMGDDAPHETLQLFPLHPTGILQDKSACSVCSVSDDSSESLDEEESRIPDKHPPFDFFGSSGKCSR